MSANRQSIYFAVFMVFLWIAWCAGHYGYEFGYCNMRIDHCREDEILVAGDEGVSGSTREHSGGTMSGAGIVVTSVSTSNVTQFIQLTDSSGNAITTTSPTMHIADNKIVGGGY